MPTTEQLDNLDRLANYLDSLAPDYDRFDMRTYFGSRQPSGYLGHCSVAAYSQLVPSLDCVPCGTAACALGHGPAAGVRISGDDTWMGYCRRAFGCRQYHSDLWDKARYGTPEEGAIYDRLFASALGGNHYDAAQRIRDYLNEVGYYPAVVEEEVLELV